MYFSVADLEMGLLQATSNSAQPVEDNLGTAQTQDLPEHTTTHHTHEAVGDMLEVLSRLLHNRTWMTERRIIVNTISQSLLAVRFELPPVLQISRIAREPHLKCADHWIL
jgi:hypothetical protein